MRSTSIEWTDDSWNPFYGCSRISEGCRCRNCYAEGISARFSDPGQPFEGFARRTRLGPVWTGKVQLIEKHLADPEHWKRPRRIFVNSMSDCFHEALTFEEIARVFDVMVRVPRHTYQILTKRAARMREFMLQWSGSVTPPPHIWLGVSVEHQAAALERIPLLLRTPAAVRFLSVEPLLEAVDLRPFNELRHPETKRPMLDWIIVGGEGGHRARPADPAWLEAIVQQADEGGIPPFVKQLGAVWAKENGSAHPKAKIPEEWPAQLRRREFPRAVS